MSRLNSGPYLAAKLEAIQTCGFVSIDLGLIPLGDILGLFKRAGYTISQTTLTPKVQHERSRARTLSGIYGKGSFPYHTDFAFTPIPPRIILLANENDHDFDRATYVSSLFDLPSEVAALLKSSIWTLQSRLGTFVVSSYQSLHGHVLLRWDLDFLSPYNESARKSAEAVPMSLASNKKEVIWTSRSAVMIDNWGCAHARADAVSALEDDNFRRLTRYEVWKHA